MSLGCQEPTFRVAEEYAKTWGAVAEKVEAAKGVALDPCQRAVLDDWLAVRPDGMWAHRRNGLMEPRQNGKTASIEARIDFGILVVPSLPWSGGRGERFLYTAHDYSTVQQLFDRLKEYYGERANDPDARYPWLNARVSRVRRSTGKEAIFFKNGGAVYFSTRTKSSKRGFTVDTIIADESQELTDAHLKAILSTASAAPLGNPQYIFCGTPPGPESTGDVFASMHYRLREGEDDGSDGTISWTEWSVNDVAEGGGFGDVRDTSLWYRVNPALGRRIDEETVLAELGTYKDELSFAQERLGYWLPRHVPVDAAIPADAWDACRTDEPPEGGRTVYAVKFSVDGRRGVLAACVRPDEGAPHVEVVACRGLTEGIGWFEDWLAARAGEASSIVVDGRSNAQDLEDRLRAAGVPRREICRPSASEVGAACSTFVNAVAEGRMTHFGQPGLDAAAKGCAKRPIGSDGAFGFKGSETADEAVLEAAALALWQATVTRRDPRRKMRVL